MIDTATLMRARESAIESGVDLFVVRDGGVEDAYTAFKVVPAPTLAEALLSRPDAEQAMEDGKRWIDRQAHPLKCCGRVIHPWEEDRCLRCGESYIR